MIGESAMQVRLPYLVVIRDRKGRPRYYVRKRGAKAVLIREKPSTPEFLDAYRTAVEAIGLPGKPATALPRTWRWLCEAYMASAEFHELSRATKRQRELVLQSTWAEPTQPGAPLLMGDCPLSHFKRAAVLMLRDRKLERPEAGNHRIKVIRSVFAWAIDRGFADSNPARDVRNLKPKNKDGHHTWTVEEVRQYTRRHPLGSKAHLALGLFLFTGARISDVARFGRPMVSDGQLRWTVAKGGGEIELPILPQLQAVIDATPLTGIETYLVTQYGRPFSVKGLGQWFRKRCDEAGLRHCSAHGLRKAGATIAAENGATPHELQAIYGWATLKQVELYTRQANRKRLASGAMRLLVSKEG
jgi:integrase